MEVSKTTTATPRKTAAGPLPASRPAGAPAALELPTQRVHHTAQPSVEISRNAKGEPSWTVKGSGEDVAVLADEILAVEARLHAALRPPTAASSG